MPTDSEAWTIQKTLEWTTGYFVRKQVESPRLCAELLLAHVLGVPRIRLYTDYQRPLVEEELTVYRELVRRGGEHEPIAYLTGRAHFFDLELEAAPGVLIPRPDTETLVETALNVCRHTQGFESPRILDLCTGSGCIAAALAKHLSGSTVTAVDIDPAAIALARRNFDRVGVSNRVSLVEGNLYEALPRAPDPGPFHLIVSNPPYIRSADIALLDRMVRDFEPHRALDGGPDGLCLHRRILEGAPDRLLPGGRVMLEIAFDQGPGALATAARYPRFGDARVLKDAAGHDRVLTLVLA